jgi:hypothetical protein
MRGISFKRKFQTRCLKPFFRLFRNNVRSRSGRRFFVWVSWCTHTKTEMASKVGSVSDLVTLVTILGLNHLHGSNPTPQLRKRTVRFSRRRFCHTGLVKTVTRCLLRIAEKDPAATWFQMAFDVVDTVWSTMREDKFYSPDDLANTLEHPVESVTRILEFLARYDLVEEVTKNGMIFRKIASWPSPSELFWDISAVVGNPLPDNSIPDSSMP